MQRKLIKAWGPYAAGATVADNKEEAEATPGAVRVSRARFAKLHQDGHFAPAEPERPIPAEVRTSGRTSARTPARPELPQPIAGEAFEVDTKEDTESAAKAEES